MALNDKTVETIASHKELVEWFAVGEKPKSNWRVGTEHEKVLFQKNDLTSVPYEGKAGVAALLQGMGAKGAGDAIIEKGITIGLMGADGGAISLEPGGQFELSGAPVLDLHETARETQLHLDNAKAVGDALNIGFLSLGMAPTYTRENVARMPKGRYKIMTAYMPKVGSLGLDMMYRTATIQANVDFSSEADMVMKMRVALALQPIATALFANSPFTDGKPNGNLSQRSRIWLDTDNDRTGMLDFAFEDGFGYERYAQWVLDVPMYFVKRGDTYHDVAGASFKDFLAGKLSAFPGERPSIKDWEDHLSTAFPEVRLKRYLEMRGADMGPQSHIPALSAFWVGLLYDSSALAGAWELVKNWTAEERLQLRQDAPKSALQATIKGRKVLDIARDVLALAQEGLQNRNIRDPDGHDERIYLAPLFEIVGREQTLADQMLELYHSSWKGSLIPIFTKYAF